MAEKFKTVSDVTKALQERLDPEMYKVEFISEMIHGYESDLNVSYLEGLHLVLEDLTDAYFTLTQELRDYVDEQRMAEETE